LEVIGEALKKRLCLIDLSEMLEDEEADGDNKFRKIKEMNRRMLNQLGEVNGALFQTHEKVLKK
jgi:hypothetical protein